MVRLSSRKRRRGLRQCPGCKTWISVGYKNCPECGYELRGSNGSLLPLAGQTFPANPLPAEEAIGVAGGPPGDQIASVEIFDASGQVQAAIVFAAHCGGISQAKRMLDTLKTAVEQLA